jgi:hypothetical protein
MDRLNICLLNFACARMSSGIEAAFLHDFSRHFHFFTHETTAE